MLIVFIHVQLEGLFIQWSYILVDHSLQVNGELFQLIIFFVVEKGDDRDTVFQLIHKWVDWVIYDDNVLNVSIFKDPEVFHEESRFGLNAILSVQPVVDKLIMGVKIIANCICITIMRSSKDNDLKIIAKLFYNFWGPWSYINSSLNHLTCR